jgi:predicted regulator of Ras-like GTPase activity (Roadblock/LC7/MglB family)
MNANTPPNLDWLMENFLTQVPGTDGIVLATSDGLRKHQAGLSADNADKLSAISTGLCSLGRGIRDVTGPAGGGVRQVLIEHDNALLFVHMAGPNAVLCVLASSNADIGVVGHEMAQLVKKVPEHLGAAPRTTTPAGRAQ